MFYINFRKLNFDVRIASYKLLQINQNTANYCKYSKYCKLINQNQLIKLLQSNCKLINQNQLIKLQNIAN